MRTSPAGNSADWAATGSSPDYVFCPACVEFMGARDALVMRTRASIRLDKIKAHNCKPLHIAAMRRWTTAGLPVMCGHVYTRAAGREALNSTVVHTDSAVMYAQRCSTKPEMQHDTGMHSDAVM